MNYKQEYKYDKPVVNIYPWAYIIFECAFFMLLYYISLILY